MPENEYILGSGDVIEIIIDQQFQLYLGNIKLIVGLISLPRMKNLR